MSHMQRELINFAHTALQGLSPIQQFTLRMDVRQYRGVPCCNGTADPTQIAAKQEGICFDLMSV